MQPVDNPFARGVTFPKGKIVVMPPVALPADTFSIGLFVDASGLIDPNLSLLATLRVSHDFGATWEPEGFALCHGGKHIDTSGGQSTRFGGVFSGGEGFYTSDNGKTWTSLVGKGKADVDAFPPGSYPGAKVTSLPGSLLEVGFVAGGGDVTTSISIECETCIPGPPVKTGDHFSPAFVQTKQAQGVSATTVSATFTSSTTSGNAIVVGVAEFTAGGAFSSITDNKSNTYTVDAVSGTGGTNKARVVSALNITGGSSHQVTANSGVGGFISFVADEFSGLATSSAADQSNTSTDGSAVTTHTVSSTGTLAQADELVFGMGAANSLGGGTITNGDGTYTSPSDHGIPGAAGENGIAAYKPVSATTAVDWTSWNTSAAAAAASALMTYKAAAAASTDAVPLYQSIGGFNPVTSYGLGST